MIKEVNVSNEDIFTSKSLDPRNCAIAKALNRSFVISNAEVRFDIKEYAVDVYFVLNNKIYDKNKITNYRTMTSFITSFDMGLKELKPFQFGVIL